jgi:hypothetical protein
MFAQTKGIDFSALVEGNKVVIFQLSVGLIGLENSKFIAKLLIAKINQVAFAQQSVSIVQRRSIHFYIDEAHIYANSPAIEQILSGARKYSLSLVLVLQHLDQVESNILNSLLTNTATQVFFRQSERDSKRLSSSFSFFEPEDFMELDLGEALVRVNMRNNDFNLKTLPLKSNVSGEEAEGIKSYIVQNSREVYALSKEEVGKIISLLIPLESTDKKMYSVDKKDSEIVFKKKHTNLKQDTTPSNQNSIEPKIKTEEKAELEDQKQEHFNRVSKQEVVKKHRSLQNFIKTMGLQRGFRVTIEEETKNGGRVDVGLIKDKLRIAVEISISNTPEYEVKNIQKCIDAKYDLVFMLSESELHLNKIQELFKSTIDIKFHPHIFFLHPKEFVNSLAVLTQTKEKPSERVNGWRVQVNYHKDDEQLQKQRSLKNQILKALEK